MSSFYNYIFCIPFIWKCSICVILFVLILLFILKWFVYPDKKNQLINGSNEINHDPQTKILNLLQDSARWDAMSKQETNSPAYALMHSIFALAYANVVRQFLTDQEVYNLTGISMSNYISILTTNQQQCLDIVNQQCPGMLPSTYSVASGWIS